MSSIRLYGPLPSGHVLARQMRDRNASKPKEILRSAAGRKPPDPASEGDAADTYRRPARSGQARPGPHRRLSGSGSPQPRQRRERTAGDRRCRLRTAVGNPASIQRQPTLLAGYLVKAEKAPQALGARPSARRPVNRHWARRIDLTLQKAASAGIVTTRFPKAGAGNFGLLAANSRPPWSTLMVSALAIGVPALTQSTTKPTNTRVDRVP